MGFYLPIIISVGRLAGGALRVGRCYFRLAHVPSVLGFHDPHNYTYNSHIFEVL